MNRTVRSTIDGRFEVADQAGNQVAGPFASNAAAWAHIDKLNPDVRPKKGRRKKGRPAVVSVAPKSLKPHRAKSADRKMARNAAKAPGWVRDIAAAKFDPAAKRTFRDHKLGTFGAASPVRQISVEDYLHQQASKRHEE